jgi:hypothetical protein
LPDALAPSRSTISFPYRVPSGCSNVPTLQLRGETHYIASLSYHVFIASI